MPGLRCCDSASRGKIITAPNQFDGLKRGKKLLKRYQEYFPGTLQCNELNRTADAVFVMRVGAPVYTFRYWVTVFNPGYRKGKFAKGRWETPPYLRIRTFLTHHSREGGSVDVSYDA